MDDSKLKAELTDDPLIPPRGYSGMTNAEATVDLNTEYREQNVPSLTGSQVFNAIVKDDFVVLSVADQQRVWNVLHLGEINPFGIEADLFVDIFGAGSATITALQDIRKRPISRAVELGLGRIREGDVQRARALP